ncbi:MAG TPA: hypothetical protein VIH85_05430, partial [Solirubrobacteraceae bacterium]
AHSNALTTSPGLLSSINPTSLKAGSVATEMAHDSIPRSGALLGSSRQQVLRTCRPAKRDGMATVWQTVHVGHA